MKYRMTLYVADRKINDFMECVDLKPKHKVYVSLMGVDFETSTLVHEQYFLDLIEKSRTQKGYWIPAIEFCGLIYCAEEIKEISDGNKIIFCQTREKI